MKTTNDLQIERLETALKGYQPSNHSAGDYRRANIALLKAFLTEARTLGIVLEGRTEENIMDCIGAEVHAYCMEKKEKDND
jgi:hypothetical protein